LAVLCSWPGFSVADDTEIFFSRSENINTVNPNVLFMFDTSGSMTSSAGDDGNRLDAVRQSVIDLVSTAENVDIGIGAFAGSDVGGAILFPAKNLNEDICPEANCNSVQVISQILDVNDDGTEGASGAISLDEDFLEMGQSYADGSGAGSPSTVALRFQNVKLPRGATVENAQLRLRGYDYEDSDTALTIHAEATGDSPPLSNVDYSLSGRVSGAASAAWNPDTIDEGDRVRPDITAVIQEIANRGDWCGGNSLTLLIEGTGYRTLRSLDASKWTVPTLDIVYDPKSVDFYDTCLSTSTSASVSSSGDDVIQHLATGVVSATDQTLRLQSASGNQIIGLRFSDVKVPKNAEVVNARIKITSAGMSGNNAVYTISGEQAGDSTPFDTGIPNDLSSRSLTASAVSWTIDTAEPNSLLTTTDLSTIVKPIVASADWVSGNALNIFLSSGGGAGQLQLNSIDKSAATKAQLFVDYQLDGTDLNGTKITLRTAREEMIDIMYNMPARGGTPLVDYFYEAALYFRGEGVDFGTTRGYGSNRDDLTRLSSPLSYTGGTIERPAGCSEFNLNDADCILEKINGDPIYTVPDSGACQANNIVLLSDGAATTNNSTSRIQGLTGISSCESRSVSAEDCGVELARWLYENDHDPVVSGKQNLITHTIGFAFSSPFLKDVAEAGGGQFQSVNNAGELTNVFRNIVTESANVDTSFVAPAVTISQFSQLANRNDLYFAMFKPGVSAKWDGNLKKYELNKIDGKTTIVDSLGVEAINTTDGSIKPTAKSFWSATVDGGSVQAGGAAGKLSLTRNLYTYFNDTTDTPTLESFDESNSNLTDAVLGLSGAPTGYRDDLIKWSRGVDIADIDDDGDVTEVRMQMGDPLHSSPFILNYKNTDGTFDSLIFMGTNEGFLHAVDAADGTEKFGIIPPELLPNLDYYYQNKSAGPNNRRYGLDGEVVGWIDDTNGNRFVDAGEAAYVAVGMRRGGRHYYVFDVSDVNNPELAWSVSNSSVGFEELGQTWSRPIKTRLSVAGTVKDVLIFSGGYDSANDNREYRKQFDTMGRAIFIVNATTGALLDVIDNLDEADMDYSIPSTPRVIDINQDGMADYLFVGDMGGQIWRFDFDNQSTGSLSSAITGGVIADLSENMSKANNRRFFYEPDVALVKDYTGREFLTLSLGSGWRAHPLNEDVDDRFYVLRDYAVFSPPRNEAGDITYATLTESMLFDATSTDTTSDTGSKSDNGFFLSLASEGEKVLSHAVTVDSKVLFTSYVPSADNSNVCSAAVGGSQFYALSVLNAKAVLDLDGDNDAVLDLDDRLTKLRAPGIAPSPSVLLPEISKDAPLTLVGFEKPEGTEDLDFGQLQRRTFWGESGYGEFAEN